MPEQQPTPAPASAPADTNLAPTAPATPVAAPAPSPAGIDLRSAPTAADTPTPAGEINVPLGFDRAKLQRDIAQAGVFAADSVKALRAGGMSDAMIAEAQQVYQAAAQMARAEVIQTLGGQDALNQIIRWANSPTGLDAKQIARLNDGINSPDATERALAASSLRALYENATGNRLGARAQPTVEGGPARATDPNPLPLVRDNATLEKLRRDPRYRPEHPESAAYRALVHDRQAEYGRWRRQGGSSV